jgi:hypothetical protein
LSLARLHLNNDSYRLTEYDNFRDGGEFANSATDGYFSGVNHPEISDECFSFK